SGSAVLTLRPILHETGRGAFWDTTVSGRGAGRLRAGPRPGPPGPSENEGLLKDRRHPATVKGRTTPPPPSPPAGGQELDDRASERLAQQPFVLRGVLARRIQQVDDRPQHFGRTQTGTADLHPD